MANVYITPHAVQQFRQRIANLPRHEVERTIGGILRDAPQDRWRVTENGKAICVRARHPFCVRLILAPGKGHPLAVVTVLKHGKRGANHKRLREYRQSA